MDARAVRALAENRDLWDKRVRAHLKWGLYPSARVVDGDYDVGEPEITELGDVHGKRLVHLQCNGGADTIAWARRGARVTGVDFSSVAIEEARRLAVATGIDDARFLCADLYEVTVEAAGGPFDIVYTSMGVLWWLPDLEPWARLVHALLVDGGMFYLHEIHPMAMCLQEDEGGSLVLTEDYFGDHRPIVYEAVTGTYYDAPEGFAAEPANEHGHVHTIGEVVTVLAGAGLRIDLLREHALTTFRMHPSMVWNDDDRRWTWPDGARRIPVTFSLRAVR